jgi:hypothetical protein
MIHPNLDKSTIAYYWMEEVENMRSQDDGVVRRPVRRPSLAGASSSRCRRAPSRRRVAPPSLARKQTDLACRVVASQPGSG